MKGAIFDVDGTVLDSMTVWLDITNEFFAEHGIGISKEENLSYCNMSFEESLLEIHRHYLSEMSVDEMFAEFRSRAAVKYAEELPPKKHACEYIRSLHDNGIKLAVSTSGFPELVYSAFKRLGIYDIFSAYTFSSEVGCSKSSPDVYLLAAERLELMPEECTVYEDIVTGIKSAKSAGFRTVAIADDTNIRDKNRLIRYSDRYITGWDELLSNI